MKEQANYIGAGSMDQYFNILPIITAIATSPDEEAERLKAYNEIAAKYPITSKIDCLTIRAVMQDMDGNIEDIEKQRVLGTTDRVGLRYILAYQRRKSEFESIWNQMQCADKLAQAKDELFLDQQYDQLEKVQKLGQDAGKAATYVIWGMLGLVVVATGIFMYKKLKKK